MYIRDSAVQFINMADTGTIQEHSLYTHFRQVGEKLFINSGVVGNTDRKVLPVIISLLARIYDQTQSVPAVGSMFGLRNGEENFEVVGIGYTVFIDDNVLITVGVKIG